MVELGLLTPAASEEGSAILAFDEGGILDGLPWDLRESLAKHQGPLLVLSEAVLLAISRISISLFL